MIPADYYRYRIQKALVFIENHLSERISAADIARAAHFSAFHFHRLFSAYMGEPVHKYVLSRRLERGAQLLREQPSLGLAEVALSVGFETHSAFSRAFRRHFGETPSAFRSHNQTPGLVTVGCNSETGLPVGVQLVGRRGREVDLLNVAEFIQSRLGALRCPAMGKAF